MIPTKTRPSFLPLAAFGLVLLVGGCAGFSGGGLGNDVDSTPTSRSGGPRPTPDSPPVGGGGGAGAGGGLSTGGGITGSGGTTF